MRQRIKRERYGRKTAATIAAFAAGIMLCFMTAFSVQAKDTVGQGEMTENETITECSLIMAAVGEVDAKERPDASAAVVISYHDGDNIYVTGETADGWYRVRYQDLVGYVQTEQVTEIELDVEALNDEFAVEEEEGKLVVEEVERQRTELRRSRVWGAVIILLVLGVFVTGIVSTVKNGGKEGEGE